MGCKVKCKQACDNIVWTETAADDRIYYMDMLDNIAEALSAHQQITAAGLCDTPAEIAGGEGGDVDIFVYCTAIPSSEERRRLLPEYSGKYTPGESGGHWGVCDLVYIDGAEVWLMFVSEQDTVSEIKTVLSGSMPEKLENYYYPVGRLATIKNIKLLFDRNGFLENLKAMVSVYPDGLAEALLKYHAGALSDSEDLTRAAMRGDVLFYHFALDLVLDHILQALFALNRVYFPSRKRSLQYIANFKVKPAGCEETLLSILKKGSESGTIMQSFALVKGLTEWIQGQA